MPHLKNRVLHVVRSYSVRRTISFHVHFVLCQLADMEVV